MDFPHGESVTIRSVITVTDDYGNTSTTVTESTWGPCAVAPRTSVEGNDPHAPAVIVGLTIYGPAVALDADDQIVLGGVVYSIDGEPGTWVSPFTGWTPGVEVAVTRAGAI